MNDSGSKSALRRRFEVDFVREMVSRGGEGYRTTAEEMIRHEDFPLVDIAWWAYQKAWGRKTECFPEHDDYEPMGKFSGDR